MKDVSVLLLRGVNVGGVRLPMAELRAVLEGLGLEGVQTYIQSGNAVFSGALTVAALREAIRARTGLDLGMILLPLAAYEATLAACPYAAEGEAEGKTVHVIFLDGAELREGLAAHASAGERFTMTPSALYLHAPGGFGTSGLVAKLPRYLGGLQTARNWRSCLTLREMGRALTAGATPPRA